MRPLLRFLVTIILIIILAPAAWASGPRAGLDFDVLTEFSIIDSFSAMMPGVFNVDNWYSIQDQTPEIQGNLLSVNNIFLVGAGYYQNDQTYAKLEYRKMGSSDDNIGIMGSYLFNFGLFVGLVSPNLGNSGVLISPGYRYSFGKKNYVALRVDLLEGQALAYSLNSKYFTDHLYLRGRILVITNEDVFYSLGANYQISDNLIAGLAFLGNGEDNAYEMGCTWKPLDKLTLDTKLGSDTGQEFYYDISGMYQITNSISAGAQYSSNGMTMIKSRLNLDKHRLTLVIGLPSPAGGSGSTLYSLTYRLGL